MIREKSVSVDDVSGNQTHVMSTSHSKTSRVINAISSAGCQFKPKVFEGRMESTYFSYLNLHIFHMNRSEV